MELVRPGSLVLWQIGLMIWDVAVLGSGPAGSAVAIHCVRAGLRTLLVTRPPGRNPPETPETLPAIARPLLAALGMCDLSARCGLREQYSMSSAWGSDSLTTRHSLCNPAGPGWFVDRPVFDAELARLAAESGELTSMEAQIASASLQGNHWVLRLTGKNTQPVEIRTGMVADATGRASAFARRIGIRRIAFDRLVSVSVRATPTRTAATGEAMVEAAEDGWWFSAFTRSGELSLSWYTDACLFGKSDRSAAAWSRRLRNAPHTGARVEALPAQTPVCRVACTDRLELPAGVGWVSVGDACVACDPLGSSGLVRALESAKAASEMIVMDRTRDSKYLREYSEFQIFYLQRFLNDRHSFYAMEGRWPASDFWRRMR